jgi:Protein of unknown function (DUF3352)
MRRLLAILLPVVALFVAGCEGGDDSGSALDSALAYLPKDTPFVVALDTDIGGDQYRALGTLLDKFPFGDQIKGSLVQQLERSSGGLSFEDDVRPVLGNPIVVGAANAEAITADSNAFIVAGMATDQGALDDLIDKLEPTKVGEASGAALYSDGDSFTAVEGDEVVFANDESELKRALVRADGDEHFDEDSFDKALDELPESALVRIYTDLEELLQSDPGAVDARKVKWIGALRTLGLTATATDDAIDVDFRARTEGDLSDEDLPIAPGDEAPPVIERGGEIGVGIRDLAHIVRFGENAGQAIDPAGFGDYQRAKQTIDKQLGVSLDDDLIGQLTGNLSASIALHGGFGVRAQLKDPQGFERTLAKVADVVPSFAQGAGFGRVTLKKPRGSERFYVLSQADGGRVFFGVLDGVLVVASDARRASAMANAEPAAVPGASGSVVVGAEGERLAVAFLQEFGSALNIPDLGELGTGLLTRPLGELNGSVSASPDELRGKLTLAVE